MILAELFIVFLKIGAFSFGGGYAMIPFIQSEAVNHGYLTIPQFIDIVAISQITPGPLAANLATFVGFKQAGVIGALVATFGVCLPSFILVIIVATFIKVFNKSIVVKDTFYGLRPSVTGLILAASVQIAWLEFFPATQLLDFSGIAESVEIRSVLICTLSLVLIIKAKVSPIVIVLISAVVGAFVFK